MVMMRRRVRMMMMRRMMWRTHLLPLAASGLERSRPLRGGGLATSAATAEAMATSAASAPQAAVAACDCRCDSGGVVRLTDGAPELPDWWPGPARWMPCMCTSCGPAARDGGRRCAIEVHPIVVLGRGKLICEDCWVSCETRRKRTAAAADAGCCTKRLRSNAEATTTTRQR